MPTRTDDLSRFYEDGYFSDSFNGSALSAKDDVYVVWQETGDPDDLQVLARHRRFHKCRSCKNSLTPNAFAPSRIPKRDYECRNCNTRRRARERLIGRAWS